MEGSSEFRSTMTQKWPHTSLNLVKLIHHFYLLTETHEVKSSNDIKNKNYQASDITKCF